jgi:glyoxylase-like metal-dependent hydrolase (beta-lactamase superfamily II)
MKKTIATLTLFISFCFVEADGTSDTIKFYALDCGNIAVSDMAPFDKTGRFSGQSADLIVPCYLIRHPKGDMLWETGLDQGILDKPVPAAGGFHSTVPIRLTDQLAAIGLAPVDIDYVAISHAHPDHAGNVNLFDKSTFIINSAEYVFMFSDAVLTGTDWSNYYDKVDALPKVQFDDHYDVFGDGKVIIHSTPGHTPGSSVLELTLENSGTLLLSGDLYTHADAREFKSIPTFTMDTAATLASMEKFERIAHRKNARVIVEHDSTHFENLPKFPTYLD